MNKMFTVLKEESELILKIKNIAPDGKLPRGLLLEGKPAIKNMAKQFSFAAELDKDNEKRPKRK
jgi:serine/threonine-protein phosphatase 2B catalytic subunit